MVRIMNSLYDVSQVVLKMLKYSPTSRKLEFSEFQRPKAIFMRLVFKIQTVSSNALKTRM